MSNSSTSREWFPVFRVMTSSPPFIHHTIFVETDSPSLGTGHTYHMNGSVGSDDRPMMREYRYNARPEDSKRWPFVAREPLGVVRVQDYFGAGEDEAAIQEEAGDELHSEDVVKPLGLGVGGKFRQVCDDVPEPSRNNQCMVWVDQAVNLLKEKGVLLEEVDTPSRGEN
ncbi:hypothetical protein NA57DRAFT_55218 [Rhizodiscina lignyota]|uniref:Uncharacterized protein n=1 Tax=Rhizodiscina lignyota TaxID=1504668 RepID=A0A9P4IIT2_9PEZI|nr:hypothetical protein NA57DRAFT_55218 [Rhizodiscina lignyota]